VVWDIIQEDLPNLYNQVESLLVWLDCVHLLRTTTIQ
jgi:uncharacterized protein with HEPN domain